MDRREFIRLIDERVEQKQQMDEISERLKRIEACVALLVERTKPTREGNRP